MILSGAHVGDDYPDGKGVLPSEWCAFSGRGRRSGKWLRLMAVPPLTPAGTLARPSFTNSFNNAGTQVNRKKRLEPQSVRDEPPFIRLQRPHSSPGAGLKIGRSAVRPRPWSPLPLPPTDGFSESGGCASLTRHTPGGAPVASYRPELIGATLQRSVRTSGATCSRMSNCHAGLPAKSTP